MTHQLAFDFSGLSVADLQAMLRAGLVRAAGQTVDKRVTSYELTHAGRVLLGRRQP